jgi:hypothetical protein
MGQPSTPLVNRRQESISSLGGCRRMKLLGYDEDQVEVRVGMDELILLNDALHEICFGFNLTDNDFQRIMGVSRQEAETLLIRFAAVLEKLGIASETD